MLIFQTKYIITNKINPILFYEGGQDMMTERFEEATMWDSKEEVENVINSMDDPDLYKWIPVEITCRL